jgi:hypothetical protein
MKITITLAGEGPLDSVTIAMPPAAGATPAAPPDGTAEQDAGAEPRLLREITDVSLVVPMPQGDPQVVSLSPVEWIRSRAD